MSPVDLLAFAMWPLAALGLWLGRKVMALDAKDNRYRLLVGASLLLIIGPFLTLIVVFSHHSATVLALEYGIIAAFGGLILWAAWRMTLSRLQAMLLILVGFLMIGWGFWHLGGDFVIKRPQVDGYVSDKRHSVRSPPCTHCFIDYYVYVGGRRYAATARVFQTVEAGQRIRAKVGRASRRILSFEVRPR